MIDGTGYPAHWNRCDGIGGFEVVEPDEVKWNVNLLSGRSQLEFVFKDWRYEVFDVSFKLAELDEHLPALGRECRF
ncbi:MAG: hypothetical protein AAGA32_19795 [Pseudomonadota bacterium]